MKSWTHEEMRPAPANVRIGDEVVLAVSEQRPIVALESAVITHGLPYPDNLKAAVAMETAIRDGGATPATCLVVNGTLWVGATIDQAENVAHDPHRQKAAVRDLGPVLASGASAGLTVSATLFAAQLSGIRVFATGGIGGVHLPAGTGDVSADLMQLARTPVITVCSGVKSVLDIPHTLEFLEMVGVTVLTYGAGSFPAFYLESSRETVPTVDSPDEVARIATFQWDLGHQTGIVLGNPIPSGAAIDTTMWERWLLGAREDAARLGIRGKDVTPYLLDHVARASGGKTVEANVALLENNAKLAAQIAVALGT